MRKKSANTIKNAASVSKASLSAWFVLLVSVVLSGCSGYSWRVRQARNNFYYQNYDAAIDELKPLAEKKDNDELLYLMDLGLSQHSAGKYEEAIATFLKADKLAEIKAYTSVVTEAGTVLLNDDVKAYQGEDFEKVLISMYLAIDYTMLAKYDDALVESRRVNRKLEKMINEGGLPYEQNAFAKYLAAVLFEARKEYNDAFVDYRQVLRWRGEFPYLGEPLLRIAHQMAFSQELEAFKKKFPEVKHYQIDKGQGEIVLLLEQGKAPIKEESPNFRLVPLFYPAYYHSDSVILRVDKGANAKSYPLFDIEQTAVKELEHKMSLIVAKKVGGIVAKEVAASAIASSTKNETLGDLVRIFLYLSDHADLRSWTTLPARLHIARLTVPAGRHTIHVDMVTKSGIQIKDEKIWNDIEVKAGQKVFLSHRTRD